MKINGDQRSGPIVHTVKSVCVRFEGVGKTTLLIKFYTGACPECYIPTVFDNWAKDVEIDGRLCQLGLYEWIILDFVL